MSHIHRRHKNDICYTKALSGMRAKAFVYKFKCFRIYCEDHSACMDDISFLGERAIGNWRIHGLETFRPVSISTGKGSRTTSPFGVAKSRFLLQRGKYRRFPSFSRFLSCVFNAPHSVLSCERSGHLQICH